MECLSRRREDKGPPQPIKLETGRLRRNPDLPGRRLRADHNLSRIRLLDFDRQDAVLQQNLRIILFRNHVERAIKLVENIITPGPKFSFG